MEIAVARTGLVINRVPDGMAERLIAEARGRTSRSRTVPGGRTGWSTRFPHTPAMRLAGGHAAVRAIEKILSTVVV